MAIYRTIVLTFIVSFPAINGMTLCLAGAAASSIQPSQVAQAPDIAGEWEIQEEDKSYRATLDKDGNGPYTWQDGHIKTVGIDDRKWYGTWQQPGNDREGEFDLLLSEDATEAKGVWWYTRVGDRKNIPPRQWGGSYIWKRLSTASPLTSNP